MQERRSTQSLCNKVDTYVRTKKSFESHSSLVRSPTFMRRNRVPRPKLDEVVNYYTVSYHVPPTVEICRYLRG